MRSLNHTRIGRRYTYAATTVLLGAATIVAGAGIAQSAQAETLDNSSGSNVAVTFHTAWRGTSSDVRSILVSGPKGLRTCITITNYRPKQIPWANWSYSLPDARLNVQSFGAPGCNPDYAFAGGRGTLFPGMAKNWIIFNDRPPGLQSKGV
ncbi:hypothetical protein [Curtobacterium flaccumfaciens]|uniref:hypothetical protein n=1 Tax=Curtobacterium flaccumfaciens TaxID=2035 RepID=UPI001BDF5FFE|nr:hypothetical protein [Curtobacterium flaccumfaciens]MBT1607994.1 hypothetical protein [Curtobacterium flaccumfaciens pv. betae]MBT1658225.1 hypothetical protein [Curtobacterium flaccumfaciens pv. betae]MCS0471747.1 hypothetical protein [Curtobacterium flaccumfaciens pv. betae]MCS0476296.1 hypothetical protein [Curtobacterium flaccumfaciens pv. betae]MCS0478160.1 hypothetical protein [Curtobacterium flaccumfaciens pv. betae]